MIPTSTVRPTVSNEHYPDSLLSELFHYLNNKFFHDTGNSNNINKVPEEFFINLSASIVLYNCRWTLTHLMPLVSFYTPWKHEKNQGFFEFFQVQKKISDINGLMKQILKSHLFSYYSYKITKYIMILKHNQIIWLKQKWFLLLIWIHRQIWSSPIPHLHIQS